MSSAIENQFSIKSGTVDQLGYPCLKNFEIFYIILNELTLLIFLKNIMENLIIKRSNLSLKFKLQTMEVQTSLASLQQASQLKIRIVIVLFSSVSSLD